MTNVSDLLDEDARRRHIAKESTPAARCYGDEVRERAAREGRIGFHRVAHQSDRIDRQRVNAHAAESERLAEWAKLHSPGWPAVVRVGWIVKELPDDILDDPASSLDRMRVAVAAALRANGWRKLSLTSTYLWVRGSDFDQMETMPPRLRNEIVRRADCEWSARQGVSVAEAAE